jgi:hypothetical protein
MSMKIQILAWDKHKHVAELNWLKGFNPIHFDNSRMLGSMFILTWVGIIFVIILHRAKAMCKILTNIMPIEFAFHV